MSLEPQKVSEEVVEQGLGSLRGCLMDGDAEQRSRERSIRRRSLAISIVLQSTFLAALMLVSLFGKPQTIALANVTPVPPYSHYRGAPQNPDVQRPRPTGPTTVCHVCPTLPISPTIPTRDTGSSANPTGEPQPPGIGDGIVGLPDGQIPLLDGRQRLMQPNTTEPQVRQPRVVRITTIDPAMLIHRVEPAYPALARQIHKEGRVELRAIIGTDGTIQSLQIVGGDPLFLLSAREAVQQWRYKPTILNGQAVEIDTYITVIYTMQH